MRAVYEREEQIPWVPDALSLQCFLDFIIAISKHMTEQHWCKIASRAQGREQIKIMKMLTFL